MRHPRRPAECDFPLRLGPGRALALVGITVVLALGFLLLALGNERGLVWMGLLELTPEAATRFYAAAAAVLGLGAFPGACAVAAKGLWLDQRVAFVEEGVLLPAGFWSAEEVVVAFRDIRDLGVSQIGEERLLTLSLSGRRFRIGSSWLPSDRAFDEISERVSSATRAPDPTPI